MQRPGWHVGGPTRLREQPCASRLGREVPRLSAHPVSPRHKGQSRRRGMGGSAARRRSSPMGQSRCHLAIRATTPPSGAGATGRLLRRRPGGLHSRSPAARGGAWRRSCSAPQVAPGVEGEPCEVCRSGLLFVSLILASAWCVADRNPPLLAAVLGPS
eukprot:8440033-Pyramimonas_sp.AAC.1